MSQLNTQPKGICNSPRFYCWDIGAIFHARHKHNIIRVKFKLLHVVHFNTYNNIFTQIAFIPRFCCLYINATMHIVNTTSYGHWEAEYNMIKNEKLFNNNNNKKKNIDKRVPHPYRVVTSVQYSTHVIKQQCIICDSGEVISIDAYRSLRTPHFCRSN